MTGWFKMCWTRSKEKISVKLWWSCCSTKSTEIKSKNWWNGKTRHLQCKITRKSSINLIKQMSMRPRKFWWPEFTTWWIQVGFTTKPCMLLSEKAQKTWGNVRLSWKSTWTSSEESWRTVALNRTWTEMKSWGSLLQSRERDSEKKIPFKIQQDARVCIALIQPMVWLLMGCEAALPTDLIFHWFQEIFFFDFIFALLFLKSDNLFEHTYFLMRLLNQNVNFICIIIY